MKRFWVFLIAGKGIVGGLDGRMDQSSGALIAAFAADSPAANRFDPLFAYPPGLPIRPRV